ncbi:MAG: substrate-binding domain-containing protein [Nitrospirae bacterium]|nr:substrate-binding domain-containing protein [Nitrospirota bacterium]
MNKSLMLSLSLLFLAATIGNSFADEIRVGAGAAPSSAVLKPVKEHFESATGIKLVHLEQGPKLALQGVIKGELDVAGAGVSFDEWIALMKKEGVEVKADELRSFIVGKSRAVAMINKSNPVKSLTKAQLKDIFSGKALNWKDVGGSDMPILVVFAKLTPGMNSLYVNRVLDGTPITKEALDVSTGPDLRQAVASNTEAIGISAVGVADDSVTVPEQPEASSDITFITRGEPSANVKKLIEFITGAGRKYLK